MISIVDVYELLEKTEGAFLGTIEADNRPFVTAPGFVPRRQAGRLDIWLLLSGIARHTKNLVKNPSVSIAVADTSSTLSVLERPRVSLLAKAEYPAIATEEIRAAYFKRYPQAVMILQLPDFKFCRCAVSEAHYYAGFGSTTTFKLSV